MRFIDQVRAITNNIDHEAMAKDYFEQELKPLIMCNATRGFTYVKVSIPSDGPVNIRYDLVVKLLETEGFDPPIISFYYGGVDLQFGW